MSWRRLQHVTSVTIFRLPRRLEDVFQIRLEDVLKTSWKHLARRLEDVFKTSWKIKNCYTEDVLKTSWGHVLKTSWRQTKCLLGIYVSNHGLLTNLNQYLTNLYLANLYLKNLRRIQNALISIFVLFWNIINRIKSKLTLQNWWDNKNEVWSNILPKYNEWSFILTFVFNLHLENIFTLKKSPTFANLLMEEPCNWFAIGKKWE